MTVKRLPSGVLYVRGTGESFRSELRMQIDNIPLSSWEPGAGEIVIEDGKVRT